MHKSSHGIIMSVRNISEVGQSMVHCSLCGKDFIPSLDCDVFPLTDKADANGEMPLQCEVCMDRGFASEGVGVLDMSRPDGVRVTPPGRPKTPADSSMLSRVRDMFRKK